MRQDSKLLRDGSSIFDDRLDKRSPASLPVISCVVSLPPLPPPNCDNIDNDDDDDVVVDDNDENKLALIIVEFSLFLRTSVKRDGRTMQVDLPRPFNRFKHFRLIMGTNGALSGLYTFLTTLLSSLVSRVVLKLTDFFFDDVDDWLSSAIFTDLAALGFISSSAGVSQLPLVLLLLPLLVAADGESEPLPAVSLTDRPLSLK